MNNLIKMIIYTGYNSNKKLLLRLYRNTDCVRNFKNLSEKTLNKIINIRKEEFNRFVNIQSCGWQLNNVLPVEKNDKSSYVSENQHARNFFYNSVHYAKTVVTPSRFKVIVTNEEAQQILDTDWSTAELHDLVYAIKRLSYNIMSNDIRINETKYNNIFNTLHTRIPDLNDELLEEILKCLIPFREHTTVDLEKIFNLLDKQCEERFKKWSIDKILLMCDIFCCLRIHKDSNFIWKIMRKMNSKLNKLTSKNLVQLLYLVNVSRKSELNMYEVEVRLEQLIDDLSIDELGIVAMGFFKSKSKIRNSVFLKNIINRLITDLDKVDTITLAALLKLIRYSMKFNEVVHFRMLLNNLLPYIPKYDLMCLTHIAHAFAKAIVYEKPLIDAIINRICNEIKYTRIKDMERITFMISTFNIDTGHPIYNKIIEEITDRMNSERREEIFNYPHVLPNLLQHLSLQDIYPIHLLKVVMDPSYIKKIHKGNPCKLGYSYSILHYSIKIDRPEYTGPFLEEGTCQTLTKLHWKLATKATTSLINRLFNEIIYILQGYITKDVDLYIGRLLPNIIPNFIVIGIDENQNYVSAKPILSEISDLTIKRVDDTFPKNVKWIAFVVIHYIHKIKGVNKPTGVINAKLRQLKRTGYIPVLITDDDWIYFKNLEEKANHVKNLIQSALTT